MNRTSWNRSNKKQLFTKFKTKLHETLKKIILIISVAIWVELMSKEMLKFTINYWNFQVSYSSSLSPTFKLFVAMAIVGHING